MVRVTIELLPHGYEEGKTTLGVIEIANDGTGGADEGNYDVRLSKEPPIARRKGVWKTGKVLGFPRKKLGPYDLLFRALRDCVEDRNREIGN